MCNKSGQFRQSIKLIQLDPALIYARIEIKNIDQNPISLAPSLWPQLSRDIKGTSLRKHACSRAKVGTAPMHRNAGSCCTSVHWNGGMGKNGGNYGNMCEHRGKNTGESHEFHNISPRNPKPLAHMTAQR